MSSYFSRTGEGSIIDIGESMYSRVMLLESILEENRGAGTNTGNIGNKKRCVIGTISRRILNTLVPPMSELTSYFFYFRFPLVSGICTLRKTGHRILFKICLLYVMLKLAGRHFWVKMQ